MMADGYRIRPRRPEDDAHLVVVENRAAELFRQHGHAEIADSPIPDAASIRQLVGGGDAWVAIDASRAPVGFAVASPLGGFLHLKELSVDPAHGRRGIGTALVAAVKRRAGEGGFDAVSLTTFRDVPFNAPFYRRLGFAELAVADAPHVLSACVARECPEGCDPQTRALMVWRAGG